MESTKELQDTDLGKVVLVFLDNHPNPYCGIYLGHNDDQDSIAPAYEIKQPYHLGDLVFPNITRVTNQLFNFSPEDVKEVHVGLDDIASGLSSSEYSLYAGLFGGSSSPKYVSLGTKIDADKIGEVYDHFDGDVISKYLKARRMELGLTPNQASHQMGVSSQTIHRWEKDGNIPLHRLFSFFENFGGVDNFTIENLEEKYGTK